jgi:hypothetical protein
VIAHQAAHAAAADVLAVGGELAVHATLAVGTVGGALKGAHLRDQALVVCGCWLRHTSHMIVVARPRDAQQLAHA